MNANFGTSEGLLYNAGTLTFYGQIAGSGGLTKSGGGILTLDPRASTSTATTSNSFSGIVTVNAGTLTTVSDVRLGSAV